jgi:hypothetical protein
LQACYGAPASFSAVASALKSDDSKKTTAAAKPKSTPKASRPSAAPSAKPAAPKTAPPKTAAVSTPAKPGKRPAIRRSLGPKRTAKRSGGRKPAKRGPTLPATFHGNDDGPRVIDAPASRALPGEDEVPVRDVN